MLRSATRFCFLGHSYKTARTFQSVAAVLHYIYGKLLFLYVCLYGFLMGPLSPRESHHDGYKTAFTNRSLLCFQLMKYRTTVALESLSDRHSVNRIHMYMLHCTFDQSLAKKRNVYVRSAAIHTQADATHIGCLIVRSPDWVALCVISPLS
jgi:hypothetical protein